MNSWISPYLSLIFHFCMNYEFLKIFLSNFPFFSRHTFAIIIKKIVYSLDFMEKIPTLSVKNPRAKFYDDEKHTKIPQKISCNKFSSLYVLTFYHSNSWQHFCYYYSSLKKYWNFKHVLELLNQTNLCQ